MLLTVLLVLAIVASSALVFTNRVELLKLAVILSLWAAVVAAFVSVIYRRQSDVDQAKARDLKLVYDLQLDREISARREYELSVESHLRRELASELRAQASDEVAGLRAELAALRANLEILFDTDLAHRPAIETDRSVPDWDSEALPPRPGRVDQQPDRHRRPRRRRCAHHRGEPDHRRAGRAAFPRRAGRRPPSRRSAARTATAEPAAAAIAEALEEPPRAGRRRRHHRRHRRATRTDPIRLAATATGGPPLRAAHRDRSPAAPEPCAGAVGWHLRRNGGGSRGCAGAATGCRLDRSRRAPPRSTPSPPAIVGSRAHRRTAGWRRLSRRSRRRAAAAATRRRRTPRSAHARLRRRRRPPNRRCPDRARAAAGRRLRPRAHDEHRRPSTPVASRSPICWPGCSTCDRRAAGADAARTELPSYATDRYPLRQDRIE